MNIIEMINKHVYDGRTFFQPEHAIWDAHGKLHSNRGGSNLFAIYKSDMLKIGGYPESTTWGKDDDEFMEKATKRLRCVRFSEPSIQSRYHDRDVSNDPWYSESNEMKGRGWNNRGSQPIWWHTK